MFLKTLFSSEDDRGPPPEYRGQEDEDEEEKDEEEEKGKGKKLSGTWICVIANLAILIVVIIVVTLLVIFLLRGRRNYCNFLGTAHVSWEGRPIKWEGVGHVLPLHK